MIDRGNAIAAAASGLTVCRCPAQSTFYKLTADGRLDSSFARQGVPQEIPWNIYGDMGFDARGRITVASYLDQWYEQQFPTKHLIRFLPDGTLDSSFGDKWIVTVSGDIHGWFLHTLVVSTPDGGQRLILESYWMEDDYFLDATGRLIRSESNNGFQMGRLQFSGALLAASAAESSAAAVAASVVPVQITQGGAPAFNSVGDALMSGAIAPASSGFVSSSAVAVPSVAGIGDSEDSAPDAVAAILDQTDPTQANSVLDECWVGSPLEAERLDSWWEGK